MRAEEVDEILDRHRERFRALLVQIAREEREEDPFGVSLDDFLTRSDADRGRLALAAARRGHARIERELAARGALWIVMVGSDVVLSSLDRTEIPDAHELVRLARPLGRVPYFFEAPLVEEIPSTSLWAATSVGIRGDAYPTIPLAIDGRVMVADLDTGSHGTFIDFAQTEHGAPPVWHVGTHLGRTFAWTPVRAEIAAQLHDADRRTVTLAVRLVRDWQTSPFVRIHAERVALAGRDLLRALGAEVVLRPRAAETRLE